MRTVILVTLTASSFASAQSSIDFNNLPVGVTLSSQFAYSRGVNFIANAFAGPNVNNTAEPWATNTGLTVSDYVALDPARPGYAVGTPMLFSSKLVRTIANYTAEDGDPSVLTTFAEPITSATVTFVGIAFAPEAAYDTQLLALDASNNILAAAHAVGAATTSQQNLTVSVPGGFYRLAIVPGNYNDVVGFDNLVYTNGTATGASWILDGDGYYEIGANWLRGERPSGVNPIARFGQVITQPRTVSFGDSYGLNRIVFDSAIPYTLAAPSGAVVYAVGVGAELAVLHGSHKIETEVRGFSTLLKSGEGMVSIRKLTLTGQLSVSAGAINFDGGATVASKVGGVSVANGAQLALGFTPLVLTAMALDDVRLLLQSGRLKVGLPGTLQLGYALGNTLSFTSIGGESIASTSVVIRATLAGDADLDLDVDFDDLLSLAQNYNPTVDTRNWRQGDFTYNGIVDFDDLLLLAQQYGNTGLSLVQRQVLGTNVSADFQLALSFVPEPSITLASAAPFLFTRRRRVSAGAVL
jgi:hypothetical protein